MDHSDWSHLWTDLERYALVRTRSAGFVVVDTKKGTALLLEDDDVREEITRQMLRAGARVLERFPP
jgi:hypothetical protein